MRFLIAVCVMALTVGRACAGSLPEEIVARQVHSIIPSDGAGGVAVVLRLGGRTSFFDYGWADRANEKPVTTDSLFNLASLRKVFEATLLARSVRDGELGLEDSSAKYISELQGGGDIPRHARPARHPHLRSVATPGPSALAGLGLHIAGVHPHSKCLEGGERAR
jgi:CubicO group peptidase (beta-lactamase class C family)